MVSINFAFLVTHALHPSQLYPFPDRSHNICKHRRSNQPAPMYDDESICCLSVTIGVWGSIIFLFSAGSQLYATRPLPIIDHPGQYKHSPEMWTGEDKMMTIQPFHPHQHSSPSDNCPTARLSSVAPLICIWSSLEHCETYQSAVNSGRPVGPILF